MTIQPLRLLTLSAVSTLLVLGSGPTSYVDRASAGGGEHVRLASARAATAFPTTGLGTGAAPAIPYLFASKPAFLEGNWRLHRTDGSSLKMPRLTWSAWAAMGRGVIASTGTEAGPVLQRVGANGKVHTRSLRHFGLAVSSDDKIVGWLGDGRRPHVVEGGGHRHFTLARLTHGKRIASIWGERTCREQDPEGGGCTVFANARRRVWISDSHGIVVPQGPMLEVADVDQHGRVLGLDSRRTSTRADCWGLYRISGHRAFRTCHYRLVSFSPDGRRVLAERSRPSGESVRRFAILGHGGRVLRSWTFDPGRHRGLTQLTWEDAHHLLGVLHAHGTWGVVRVGTDGSVEQAGEPVTLDSDFSPYNLPLR